MNIVIHQVNAFAESGFKGNPAAVVVLEGEADPVWMQAIAKRENLSETAFVVPREVGLGLRWFTPQVEVDLCGHATLASAHILWETGRVDTGQKILFHTRSGWLSAKQERDLIELDFPAAPLTPGDLSEEIIAAIGVVPDHVFFSGKKWLLEYPDGFDLREIRPDFERLTQFEGRGLIVTCRSETPGVDFTSRYFAPWVGINEDPVTGSAHCILGPYWSKKLSKNYLTAHQLSERGGVVHVRLSGDRVYLGGRAVTVNSRLLES